MEITAYTIDSQIGLGGRLWYMDSVTFVINAAVKIKFVMKSNDFRQGKRLETKPFESNSLSKTEIQ